MSSPSPNDFEIELTPEAETMLVGIADRRVQRKIVKRMEELAAAPNLGKPMVDLLQGYRSLRALGQRYRIIYRVDESSRSIRVCAIGLRKEGDKKDVYKLAQKLFKRGEFG